MWRDPGITEQQWAAPPQAVRTLLLALQQQVRLMGIRFNADEKQIASLREQVASIDDLKAEINELKEPLGQNSNNSSKPPSSDPPSYKSQPEREPEGRKRGGPPDHQGSTRKMLPAEEVDTVVELRPARCRRCGRRLHGDDPQPERHQVSEVPPVKVEVTGYRRHALGCVVCGAHLARDFQALVECSGESQSLGEALLKQVKQLFKWWHKARDGDLSRQRLEALMRCVRQKVKKLLQAGTEAEDKKTRRTCSKMLKVERSLWTLVRREGVEPTNNTAERALRRAVLWRRKSFGTQSESGSGFVGRVLTAVESLRQQGRDVPEYLCGVCRSALSGEVCEGLIPRLSRTPT
jgi:hypothetical protein